MSQEETPKESASLTTCQNCGKNDPNLSSIDTGLKLAMNEAGRTDIPDLVCTPCFKELKKSASQGAQLKAKEVAKNKNRSEAWKMRLDMVKTGRSCLQRQEFAEAILAYEKYLTVLGIVVQKSRSELDPKLFHDNPKEITIIASVLWDLMLLYDSHMKFSMKQMETAELLSRFLRFSPVYNSIIRKAEIEVRRGKNPNAYKHLLKLCDVQASRCFIANSAFETRTDPNVIILCHFRDRILRNNLWGRRFICWYYRHSPLLAARLDTLPRLKKPIRPVLRGVARLLQLIFRLPEARDS